MKFATKVIWHYPPHLRYVATLPWEIKNSNFCRYSADMEENANKLHFKCTDFNSFMHVTVYAECIILCVFIKGFSSSLNTILNVEKHCSDVCCDEFSVPQTDCRSKQVKEEWHGKFYLQPVRRTTCYFKHRKYHNLWMNNKVRCDNYAICLHFLPYFIRFSAVQKFWKSVMISQSYIEFKGGNFFETQCILI